MPHNENLSWLYNTLTEKGINLGTIEETAEAISSDESNRRWLYETGKNSGYNMGSYEEFEQAMGLPKFQPTADPDAIFEQPAEGAIKPQKRPKQITLRPNNFYTSGSAVPPSLPFDAKTKPQRAEEEALRDKKEKLESASATYNEYLEASAQKPKETENFDSIMGRVRAAGRGLEMATQRADVYGGWAKDNDPTAMAELAEAEQQWKEQMQAMDEFDEAAKIAPESFTRQMDEESLRQKLPQFYDYLSRELTRLENASAQRWEEDKKKRSAVPTQLHSLSVPDWSSALRLSSVKELRRRLNIPKEGDKNKGSWVEQFAKGAAAGTSLSDIVTLGFGDVLGEMETSAVLKKMEAGEALTPEEQDIFDLMELRDNVEGYINSMGGATTLAKVGSGGAAAVPYILGFGGASAVGGTLAKGAKTLAKPLFGRIVKNGSKGFINKAVDAVATTALTVPFTSNTYAEYQRRTQEQYYKENGGLHFDEEGRLSKWAPTSEFERLYKAGISSFLEVFSERTIGGLIEAPISSLTRKLGTRVGLGKLYNKIDEDALLSTLHKQFGWNGTLSEFGEELFVNITDPLFTLEPERLAETLSAENLWETLLVCATIGSTIGTVSTARYVPDLAAIGKENAGFKARESEALKGISDMALRQQVYMAMQQQSIEDMSIALSDVNWDGVTRHDAINAVNYVQTRLNRKYFNATAEAGADVQKFATQNAEIGRFVYQPYSETGVTDQRRDMLVTAKRNGRTYAITTGDYASGNPKAWICIQDNYGQREQVPLSELSDIQEWSTDEYLAQSYADIVKGAGVVNQANEAKDDAEVARAAGIETPMESAEEVITEAAQQEAIQEEQPKRSVRSFVQGDEIVLKDGTRAVVNGKDIEGYNITYEDKATGMPVARKVLYNEVDADSSVPVIESFDETANQEREAQQENEEVAQALEAMQPAPESPEMQAGREVINKMRANDREVSDEEIKKQIAKWQANLQAKLDATAQQMEQVADEDEYSKISAERNAIREKMFAYQAAMELLGGEQPAVATPEPPPAVEQPEVVEETILAEEDVVQPEGIEEIAQPSAEEVAKGKNAPTETTEEPTPTAKEDATTKIEDFGEKIGGARKDVARQRIKDSMAYSRTDLVNLKDPDKILSRANIIKYVKEGEMTIQDATTLLALNMAVRGEDSRKGLWLEKYRDAAFAWSKGQDVVVEVTDKDVDEVVESLGERARQRTNIRQVVREGLELTLGTYTDYKTTYEALNYPEVNRMMKSVYIRVGRHDGKYWVVASPKASRGWPYATMSQAVAKMQVVCPVIPEEDSSKGKEGKDGKDKIGHLHIVKDERGYYRIKSRNIPGSIYLSKRFNSKKVAEQFLQDNAQELVQREIMMTAALMGSNIGMVERQGPDYRNGRDVTPQDFLDTFGVRGVEFGNWVPQAERQLYLNKSYDAIMDLCKVVGISPKAFSLGGRLALAFGSRGKSRALAHYEPLKEVINLTRMKGAGSLAHEWFHALDNYLSRQVNGNVGSMTTRDFRTQRSEVAQEFRNFVHKMGELAYSRRSSLAGPYWYEVWERAARLFESYVYNKLAEQNIESPLLVVKDTLYDESNPLMGESGQSAWPYPSAEENELMKPYFDTLFDTIQEREEDGKAVLYQIEDSDLNTAEAKMSTEEVLDLVKAAGIEVEIATPESISAEEQEIIAKAKADGTFDASNPDIRYLRETSTGEVYGWMSDGKIYLTEKGLNPETPIHEYTHIWDAVCQRENPKLWAEGVALMKQTPLWEQVRTNPAYANIADNEDALASEVHARLAAPGGTAVLVEMMEQQKAEATLIGRIHNWLRKFWRWLRKKEMPESKLNVDKFARMPLKDLAMGKRLDKSIIEANSKQKVAGKETFDIFGNVPMAQIGRRRQEEMYAILAKRRQDLSDAEKLAVIAELDKLDNNKIVNAAFHYFVNGTVRLPEDMPKVEQAVKVAEIAKVDPAAYKSPMELINAHADVKLKEARIDPDTVPTLSNKVEYEDGLAVYDVEESEESRQNMRRIINTHFGEDSSPWCLLQGDGKGNLTGDSERYWNHYNAQPKRVAFQNSKLLAFFASDGAPTWWDRQDAPHFGGIPAIRKLPDGSGRVGTVEFNETTGEWGEFTNIHLGQRGDKVYEEWLDEEQISSREIRVGDKTYRYDWDGTGIFNGYLEMTADATKTLRSARWYGGVVPETIVEDNTLYDYFRGRIQRIQKLSNSGDVVEWDDNGNTTYVRKVDNAQEFSVWFGQGGTIKTVREMNPEGSASFLADYKESNGRLQRCTLISEDGVKTFISWNDYGLQQYRVGEDAVVMIAGDVVDATEGFSELTSSQAEQLADKVKQEVEQRVAEYVKMAQAKAAEWKAKAEEVRERYSDAKEFEQQAERQLAAATSKERYREAEGNVYEELQRVNKLFNEQLGNLTEENARERILNVGMPSSILLSAGIANKPMRLYGAKLLAKAKKHGYDIADLKNLPLALSEPIAVFSGSHDDSYAVLTELHIGENNVLATMSIGKGGHDIDFNIISSVYDKREDSVVRWINEGKMLWLDKKKALDYFSVSAPLAEAQNNQELISATNIVQNFENTKFEQKQLMADAAKALADKLHTPIKVYTNVEDITDPNKLRERRRRSTKGWWNEDGSIGINVSMHNSVADIEATILHEVVAHKGLREVVGNDAEFDALLDRVWNGMTPQMQKVFEEKFSDKREAAEEYMAEIAEGNETLGVWERIVGWTRMMLDKVLGGRLQIHDKDIAYLLWLSRNRLQKGGNVADKIESITKSNKLRAAAERSRSGERITPNPEQMMANVLRGYIANRGLDKKLLSGDARAAFIDKVWTMLPERAQNVLKAINPGNPKTALDNYLAKADNGLNVKLSLRGLVGTNDYNIIVGEILPQYVNKKHLNNLVKREYGVNLRKAMGEDVGAKNYLDKVSPEGNFEVTGLVKSNKFVQTLQDSGEPIKKFQELVKSAFGVNINSSNDAYNALNQWTSKAKIQIGRYERRFVEPLLALFGELQRQQHLSYENIINYITFKSALERHNSGFPTFPEGPEVEDKSPNWNVKIAKEAIAAFEKVATEAQIKQLWSLINAANIYVLDNLVDSGNLSTELKDKIRGHRWKYYVPLMGWDMNETANIDPTALYDFGDMESLHPKGISSGYYIKQIEDGRITKPANPIAHMLNMGYRSIMAAENNRMKQKMWNLVANVAAAATIQGKHPEAIFEMSKRYMVKDAQGGWRPMDAGEVPDAVLLEHSKSVRQTIKDLQRQLGDPKYSPTQREVIYDNIKRLREEEVYRELGNQGPMAGELPIPSAMTMLRQVDVFVNGQKQTIIFSDPQVAMAINGSNVATKGWLTRKMGALTRFTSGMFTSYSPAFVVVNMYRDVRHAFRVHLLDSSYGGAKLFARNVLKVFGALVRGNSGKGNPLTVEEIGDYDILHSVEDRATLMALYGKKRVMDTLFNVFQENGGVTGYVFTEDIKSLEERLKKEADKNVKRAKRPTYSKAVERVKTMADYYNVFAETSESISRFATFLAALESGKDTFYAVQAAKDITVNFNRKGTYTQILGSWYMFFNASMQAAAQEWNVAKKNPKGFAALAATRIFLGVLNSMLIDWALNLINGDDDDERNDVEIPLHIRLSNQVLPIPTTGKYIKLPYSQGSESLFNSIGVYIYEMLAGRMTMDDGFAAIVPLLFDTFSPLGIPMPDKDFTKNIIRTFTPSAITPFVDIAQNRDAFGRPVHRERYSEITPDYQLGLADANGALVALCRAINYALGGDDIRRGAINDKGELSGVKDLFELNPSDIQHVLEYYLGGSLFGGKYFWNVVNTARWAMGDDDIDITNELPIMRRFLGEAYVPSQSTDYYELRQRLQNQHQYYNRYKEAGEIIPANIQRDEEFYRFFKKIDRAVTKQRELIKSTDAGSEEYKKVWQDMQGLMFEANFIDEHVDWDSDDWKTQYEAAKSEYNRKYNQE